MLGPFLGNKFKFSVFKTLKFGRLILAVFVAYLKEFLFNLGLALAEENSACGVGLILDYLGPYLQLLRIDAAIIKKSCRSFYICRVKCLYICDIGGGIGEAGADTENVYFGLFGLGFCAERTNYE
jgi:hypothetical protein